MPESRKEIESTESPTTMAKKQEALQTASSTSNWINPMVTKGFEWLPWDVLRLVARRPDLEKKDLVNMTKACGQWEGLRDDDKLWETSAIR